MKFLKKVLEIIFPTHCLACEKIISAKGLFCNDCWQKLQFITEPKCQVCCNPFELVPANTNLVCASCPAAPKPYKKSVILFRYNKTIGKVISDLKYRDQTFVAKKLAQLLSAHAKKEIAAADFIVPIPLHKKRLRQRRFNQSALLAHAISKTKLRADFLLRIKNTAAQVGLQKKQRQKNLGGAFILNPKYRAIVHGKKILLVDDVMTTGTTLENCAKILERAGASEIKVLTIAKTVFN